MNTDTKLDRLGNFDLCGHGVSMELECEHCGLLPGAKTVRLIKAQKCWSCGTSILGDDDAGICVKCGGRNGLVGAQPTRYAVAIVSADLIGLAVGVMVGSVL